MYQPIPRSSDWFHSEETEWQVLAEALDPAHVLLKLVKDHRVVDCQPLHDFRENWEDVTLMIISLDGHRSPIALRW